MHHADTHRADFAKSLGLSLAVGVPFLLATLLLMLNRDTALPPAGHVMLAALGMAVCNLALVVALEESGERCGPLTFPVLLAVSGVVLLMIIAEAFNRFVTDVGFGWLFPLLLAGLAAQYLALFSEKSVLLKLYLALNGVVLAALWAAGHTGVLTVPF